MPTASLNKKSDGLLSSQPAIRPENKKQVPDTHHPQERSLRPIGNCLKSCEISVRSCLVKLSAMTRVGVTTPTHTYSTPLLLLLLCLFTLLTSPKTQRFRLARCRKVLFLLTLHRAAGETVVGEVEEGGKEQEVSQPPPPWTHRYHQDVDGDVAVREYLLQEVHPRTALMCPRGLAIAKVCMLLRVGQDVVAAHPEASLTVPFAHWLVKPDDGVPSDETQGFSKCPTLQRCLGYQACLFTFGIEFCHLDPVPGQRKNLLVTVTCVRDSALLRLMREAQYDAATLAEVERRTELVLHLTYTSRLEEGVEDLSSTHIRQREEAESEVFHSTCPRLHDAARSGFHGHCRTEPPDPVAVSEALWSLLGRVSSRQCREEVQQIYCSFLYHDKGLCLPPFLVASGQVPGADPEDLLLTDASLPKVGPRPPVDTPAHLPAPLLPARLAFVILTHKDPPAVMQLLSLVYRPHHLYVLHVDRRATDMRRALTDLLLHRMPGASNIRILPASRSFVASWGSYNIVRAELEAFEELLRMGLWDFAVKLSGADLPLRDVDDLAATLAAYRGVSFVPLFGQRNKDMAADQGLVWDVWHGCEGYVYNVTRAGGQPGPQDIAIYTGSQWSILSRELVNYAVNPALRSRPTNRWQYHLQTSIIPDESYFPTVALNSPYANATRHLGFHWLKRFEGRNTLNLCRHMEDTDFCGQGPGPIEEEDLRHMIESSHRYFFARKFHTQSPTHPTRVKMSEYVRTGYYSALREHLPRPLIRQLLEAAHESLVDPNSTNTRPGDLLSLRVLPRLHVTNPCCALPFELSFKSTQEFLFWLDFTLVDAKGWAAGAARAAVGQLPPFDCYPDGHLRALRVTTWTEDPHAPHRSPLSVNMPLPFAAPGADAVHVELWFHVGPRSLPPSCLSGEGRPTNLPPGTPMLFAGLNVEQVTADAPLEVVVQLVDPRGNVRCEETKRETWEESRVAPNADGERVELASFLSLACGLMEPGAWAVRVFQNGTASPRLYKLPVVVLPAAWRPGEPGPDLRKALWRVEEVALLPLPPRGELPAESLLPLSREERAGREDEEDGKDEMGKEEEKEEDEKQMKEEEEEEEKEQERQQGREEEGGGERGLDSAEHYIRESVEEWLVCGGGLLTATLAVVFAYHWVVVPAMLSVRASPRMQRSALLVLAAVMLQIVLSSSFCR